jgi:hypothetical protein
MSELLLPVGVPMGLWRDAGEAARDGFGEVGQSRGGQLVHERYYAGWSLAFAAQREKELLDLIAVAGLDQPDEVVGRLKQWDLLWPFDPGWPIDQQLATFRHLRLLPAAVGWGNDPDDPETWLLRSIRGDREIRCSLHAYSLYFRARVDSIAEAILDRGSASAGCAALAWLLPQVFQAGLGYLDLSGRAP